MVCLSEDRQAWRALNRRSLTGLDWLNDDIGTLRQAIGCGERRLGLLIHPAAKADGPKRAIIYFHGGGWIVGSPLTHADISGALNATTGLCVISVEYRLAPEHPAPAPIEDGLMAIDYALARDPEQSLILCGDSAGAAIALAVAAAASPTAKARIVGIAACYGSYGLLDSQSLKHLGTHESGLDVACLSRMWKAAHGPGTRSPYAIEAVSRAGDPPAYILVGARDPVRDDSIALADALRAAKRFAGLDIVPGEDHGFLHGGLTASAAQAAFGRLAQWVGALPLAQGCDRAAFESGLRGI
ncbi:MAG: alpha/beta hydrolase fold domain-containing protein [Rhizobiales bacterium]|nr:alpha/beta hydrolase fold domain-containing protein [Hyphomicrobiales bacterium]